MAFYFRISIRDYYCEHTSHAHAHAITYQIHMICRVWENTKCMENIIDHAYIGHRSFHLYVCSHFKVNSTPQKSKMLHKSQKKNA